MAFCCHTTCASSEYIEVPDEITTIEHGERIEAHREVVFFKEGATEQPLCETEGATEQPLCETETDPASGADCVHSQSSSEGCARGPAEDKRQLLQTRCKSLQEETNDSIMGYTPNDPKQEARPVLLGRTNLPAAESATMNQVKSRAGEARKQQALRAFLLSYGFADVNTKRKVRRSLFHKGFAYPLHAAVTANDAEAVEVLLGAGADRSSLDSQNLTPLALARTCDKQGSHDRVVALLTA